MLHIIRSVVGFLVLVISTLGSTTEIESLERDVCIIGGGSAGTYTAIRLQQMGLRVALIEKSDLLGGQVDTSVDPVTSQTIDYGVKVFNDVPVVRHYFDYLNVSLKRFKSYVPEQKTIYANLANVTTISATDIHNENITDGLLRYQAQLQKYPYVGNGFQLPYSLPPDLLLPWGDFLAKHNLSAISGIVFGLVGAPGNILAQPTDYIANNFGEIQVRSALEGSALTEANNNNQAIYTAALARLGNGTNAFLGSNVTNIVRTSNVTEVMVSTPSGLKSIRASKLVITIPPKLPLLEPFLDLRPEERSIFGQFNNSYIWASIVKNSGVPANTGLINVDPLAAFGIPPMPAIFGTEPTANPDLLVAWYGSSFSLTDDEVKSNILDSLQRLKTSQGGESSNGSLPRIVQFTNHSPYMLTVSTEAINDGFYKRVTMLQGQHNTYWTGAAWQTQDSTAIWDFTEAQILPYIVASLRG